eukprot:2228-Eustigmatos_ZCMA.PRE.1
MLTDDAGEFQVFVVRDSGGLKEVLLQRRQEAVAVGFFGAGAAAAACSAGGLGVRVLRSIDSAPGGWAVHTRRERPPHISFTPYIM